MSGRNTALVLVIIIILIGVFAWEYRDSAWLSGLLGTGTTSSAQSQVGKTSYACDEGKTIVATYYQGEASTAPASSSTPPTPNGSAALVLSDGRSMTLPQTISGSGIRYANADESVVFWSKGNTAFITEGTDQSQTFSNCIATSNIEGQASWSTLASSTLGFSIRYPAGYTPLPYTYQELGPGKSINGTKLTIPASEATGTNLSSDSYVSVETLPKATQCTADMFLGDQVVGSTTEVTDNGVTYSMAKGGGAGAGNLYEEFVYAIPGTSPCIAVRYFIHSTQLGNYPVGTVSAFNETQLVSEFDGIRRSLVIGH
jgi:membrane-bound inhibitor of C-type lysozyme